MAIANAKLAYQWCQDFIRTDRWQALAVTGARTQPLLWASTSTKNRQYRHVLYIEELIGPDTINTITPATLDAFRDHGRLRSSLTEDVSQAHETMTALARAGISIEVVTAQVSDDGVQLFVEAFGKLLDAIQGTLTARARRNDTDHARVAETLRRRIARHITGAAASWRQRRIPRQ